jgi:ABC-type phosphate/phosphonate transport system substrate-binding protein
VVDRYAEALAALCASSPSDVTVAWLDGISYIAALAQNCGEASLQVERGRGSAASTGAAVSIVGSGITNVQALAGRDYCRLGVQDYNTWLVPSLMMRLRGLDVVSDLEAVIDMDTAADLLEAVAAGDCSATALLEADYEDLDSEIQDELNVLDTSPPMPFGILTYPLTMPLGERIRLDDALLAVDGDAALQPFLDQDGLRRVSESAFDDLSDFLDDSGLDFAQLGS